MTLVVEAAVVVAVLTVVVAGTQLPKGLLIARLTPGSVLIVVIWMLGLLLVRRAGRGLPWHEDGRAPDSSPPPSKGRHRNPPQHRASTKKALVVFVVSALATLVAGAVLELAGDAAATKVGLGGVLFGATVLALATSLPEIATGLQSIKQGDDNLAISDIFGGNAFLPVLFLVATVISGQAVLPRASAADTYLTALAILLTLVYLLGLLFRPRRRILAMGVDSLVVLVLYALGVAGLVAIA